MDAQLNPAVKKPSAFRVFWRWSKRLVIGLGLLALLLVLAALAYQAIASARDARRFPPPGKLVDVGGYRLHIHSLGEGSPTVILDAGWSDCFSVGNEVLDSQHKGMFELLNNLYDALQEGHSQAEIHKRIEETRR